MNMTIYDKAQWHIDAGENERIVLARFKAVYLFLQKRNLLSEEGLETCRIGIDDSIVLHQRLLTDKGNQFIDRYYDHVLSLDPSEIEKVLEAFWNACSV